MTVTEQTPSPAYDDCRTVEQANIRYKELFAKHNVETKGMNRGAWSELLEDHRRALLRILHGNSSDTEDHPRRQRVQVVRPTEHDDGSMTIVCAKCGEEKPTKKFPTLSGKPGVREGTCRECKKKGGQS